MKNKDRFTKVLIGIFILIIILACGRNQQGSPTQTVEQTDMAPADTVSTEPVVLESVSCEDGMTFIEDVSIPDGYMVNANESFIKTWRIQNSGTCDWSDYMVAFESGEPMGTMEQVIPDTPAGETLDISIEMTAPGGSGNYSGHWEVRSSVDVSLGGLTCVITVPSGENSSEEDSGEPAGDDNISVPPAPTNLRIAGWDMNTTKVSWDDNSENEDGFKIRRIGVAWLKNTTGPNATSFDIHSPCGENHEYFVVAFNSAGNSEQSNTITIEGPSCD